MFAERFDAISKVPTFDTLEGLAEANEAKDNFEPEEMYPRDGSPLLGDVERAAAHLAGVNEEDLLAYNTGMSAVTDAIDIAVHTAESDRPVILIPHELYSQTMLYLTTFVQTKRGTVIPFNNMEEDETLASIRRNKPDVIVAETITNNLNVAVSPNTAIIKAAREQDNQPVVVLDNTLPLSTGLPLGETIQKEDRVVVSESGTKAYTHNDPLVGWNYTKHPELLRLLQVLRRAKGTLPDTSHLLAIQPHLPEDRREFDDRNSAIFASTGTFAVAAAEGLQDHPKFVVSHPAISSHDNHERYIAEFPNGGAPVSFIYHGALKPAEISEMLWASPDVRAHAKLGHSFGFDTARILTAKYHRGVRIAGGVDTDGEALGAAVAEALSR